MITKVLVYWTIALFVFSSIVLTLIGLIISIYLIDVNHLTTGSLTTLTSTSRTFKTTSTTTTTKTTSTTSITTTQTTSTETTTLISSTTLTTTTIPNPYLTYGQSGCLRDSDCIGYHTETIFCLGGTCLCSNNITMMYDLIGLMCLTKCDESCNKDYECYTNYCHGNKCKCQVCYDCNSGYCEYDKTNDKICNT